jgi:hypothetical protein
MSEIPTYALVELEFPADPAVPDDAQAVSTNDPANNP